MLLRLWCRMRNVRNRTDELQLNFIKSEQKTLEEGDGSMVATVA